MTDIAAKLLPYRAFLADEKERLTASIRQLESEGRQDEANLTKVRLNIVSVFETLANADEAFCQGDYAAFRQRYEARFAGIPASWKAHLETARAHGDSSAQIVEEAKIETANHLYGVFRSMKE